MHETIYFQRGVADYKDNKSCCPYWMPENIKEWQRGYNWAMNCDTGTAYLDIVDNIANAISQTAERLQKTNLEVYTAFMYQFGVDIQKKLLTD